MCEKGTALHGRCGSSGNGSSNDIIYLLSTQFVPGIIIGGNTLLAKVRPGSRNKGT